jgi:hypothetical protein
MKTSGEPIAGHRARKLARRPERATLRLSPKKCYTLPLSAGVQQMDDIILRGSLLVTTTTATTDPPKPITYRLPKAGARDPHFGLTRSGYYELEAAGLGLCYGSFQRPAAVAGNGSRPDLGLRFVIESSCGSGRTQVLIVPPNYDPAQFKQK